MNMVKMIIPRAAPHVVEAMLKLTWVRKRLELRAQVLLAEEHGCFRENRKVAIDKLMERRSCAMIAQMLRDEVEEFLAMEPFGIETWEMMYAEWKTQYEAELRREKTPQSFAGIVVWLDGEKDEEQQEV